MALRKQIEWGVNLQKFNKYHKKLRNNNLLKKIKEPYFEPLFVL